jgi:hypothetical protein
MAIPRYNSHNAAMAHLRWVTGDSVTLPPATWPPGRATHAPSRVSWHAVSPDSSVDRATAS